MANPFLVLGGVAVGVITAGIGVLAVPGWITSAQDSAAHQDIAQVSAAQSVALTESGLFKPSVDALDEVASVKVKKSSGVELYTATNPSGEDWLTVAQSASGTYFARLSGSSETGSGPDIDSAVIAAGTTISGGLTAQGVPVPSAWQFGEVVSRNYAVNPLGVSVDGFSSSASVELSTITNYPGEVTTALRATRTSNGSVRMFDLITGTSMPFDRTVIVSMDVRVSTPVEMRIGARTNVASTATRVSPEINLSITGTSRIDVPIVIGAGTATPDAGITFATNSGVVGTTVDITRISILEQGDGAPFYTGDSGEINGTTAYWVGPRDRSMSVLVRRD